MRYLTISSLTLAWAACAAWARAVPLEARQNLPPPSQDPFYTAPGNLASLAPGTVIQTRKVQTTVQGGNISQTVQVQYATQNAQGGADATVATVFVPTNPLSPRRILSVQAWEDSTQLDCNPSWALTSGTGSTNTYTVSDTEQAAQLASDLGWYVIAPDHLGSASAFTSGYQSGRATLDAIRAVGSYIGMDNSKDRIALFGYSGGGHATAWAAQLADTYAPELPLVGSVSGGVPYDTLANIDTLNNGPYTKFMVLSLAGLMQAYSDFNTAIRNSLSDLGKQAFAAVSQACVSNMPSGLANLDVNSLFANYSPPVHDPAVTKLLGRETLIQSRSSIWIPAPKTPLYIFHGTADQIANPIAAQDYVNQVCSGGGSVRFVTYDGDDHFQTQSIGSNQAAGWLWQALMWGVIPPSSCGSAS